VELHFTPPIRCHVTLYLYVLYVTSISTMGRRVLLMSLTANCGRYLNPGHLVQWCGLRSPAGSINVLNLRSGKGAKFLEQVSDCRFSKGVIVIRACFVLAMASLDWLKIYLWI
jgi:hypothetical protein